MESQPVKFYSKNGEDYLLWHFFERKGHGFFIDVGAFDGIHQSNTFAFEQMGWLGICIEPNPAIFEYCKKNRARSLCLNEACVDNPGLKKVNFYVEELGLLSTTKYSDVKLDDIRRRYKKRRLDFTGLKEIKIKANTVNKIVGEHFPKLKKIDFISIDTEGNELDVLKGINFNKYDIRVLVVEANTEKDEKKLLEMLEDKGKYKLARKVKVNLFFVRTDADVERMNKIRINCEIEKQMHPLGIKFTRPIFLKERIIRQ